MSKKMLVALIIGILAILGIAQLSMIAEVKDSHKDTRISNYLKTRTMYNATHLS